MIKYIYNLYIGNTSIVPKTNVDKVLFKREVVEPKMVCLKDGRKLHIYVDKDGKYQFINEVFSCRGGVSLQDLAFWVENRENFADTYVMVESFPAKFQIFGGMVYIPSKDFAFQGVGSQLQTGFMLCLGDCTNKLGTCLWKRRNFCKERAHYLF